MNAHDWLLSEYDATTHAFPTEQTNDSTRVFYEAACAHSVPVRNVVRDSPSTRRCVNCLIAIGSTMPAELDWRF